MNSPMNISNVQYIRGNPNDPIAAVKATINGENVSLPMKLGNTEWREILRQVDAGTITIAAAD